MDELMDRTAEATASADTAIDERGDGAELRGSSFDYLTCPGTDLGAKAKAFHAWAQTRVTPGVFPYAKRLGGRPGATAELTLLDGQRHVGLNFSSQEYLSLARHPQVCAAAQAAMERYGVHSAGSTALAGNVEEATALEAELGELLRMPEVLLFPTGWAAGFGAIKGLVRETDHIVIDLGLLALRQGVAKARHKGRIKAQRATRTRVRASDATPSGSL
jgi:hypothetical protein